MVKRSHNMELCFETKDFDEFLKKLNSRPDIRRLGDVVEHGWGQRVVRLYDPDGHLIEAGEDMEMVVRRFLASGIGSSRGGPFFFFNPQSILLLNFKMCHHFVTFFPERLYKNGGFLYNIVNKAEPIRCRYSAGEPTARRRAKRGSVPCKPGQTGRVQRPQRFLLLKRAGDSFRVCWTVCVYCPEKTEGPGPGGQRE